MPPMRHYEYTRLSSFLRAGARFTFSSRDIFSMSSAIAIYDASAAHQRRQQMPARFSGIALSRASEALIFRFSAFFHFSSSPFLCRAFMFYIIHHFAFHCAMSSEALSSRMPPVRDMPSHFTVLRRDSFDVFCALAPRCAAAMSRVL